MPKRLTKYSPDWQNIPEYRSWLISSANSVNSAFCKLCKKSFKIDKGGISQVKSHTNSTKHKDLSSLQNNTTNQVLFQRDHHGVVSLGNRSRFILTDSEKIAKAEILWALKCVASGYSFASNEGCNKLFSQMFNDSTVAQGYQMSSTKCKYIIEFGIAPYLRECLMSDAMGKPYCFSFDETTTSQIKKQFDAYLYYYSTNKNQITVCYLTSIFMGHCRSDDLLQHFMAVKNEFELDANLLLHIGMDGPNVNLSFHKKLEQELKTLYNKTIFNVGTCNLHPLHNGFLKGLKQLSFNYDQFVQDVFFFFKYSAGRREDYKIVSSITEVEAENMLKHVNSRWLSLKVVLSRVLDQWSNLSQYFLKELPKESRFKHDIETTDRYKRIKEVLKNPESRIYISFAIHLAQLVEFFLLRFQSSAPLIPYLYPSFGEILSNLMRQFISKKHLEEGQVDKVVAKDALKLSKIKLNDFDLHLPIMDMDIGVKTVESVYESKISESAEKSLRIQLRKSYIEFAQHLINKFPLDNSFLQDVQYLNPGVEYRLSKKGPGAIARLALTLGRVLVNKLQTCFKTGDDLMSPESLADKIKLQFQQYQIEDVIDKQWYTEVRKDGSEGHIRLDEYWNKVKDIKNVQGEYKYAQLGTMACICLSVSHGNASAERGFSINKFVLQDRSSLKESTIIALRIVKDNLKNIDDIINFPMSARLFIMVSQSKNKYMQHLEEEKLEQLKKKSLQMEAGQKKNEEMQKKKRKSADKLDGILSIISEKESQLEIAEELMKEGTVILSSSTSAKTIKRQEIVRAQTKISIGLERMGSIKAELKDLREKKIQLEQIPNKKKKN